MVFKRHNPGCPCCDDETVSCLICEDDFNRVDSTDLGVKWTEVDGDAEIASSKLRLDNEADALVICNGEHPNVSPTNWFIEVDVVGDTVLDRARVILDYVDDDNYLYFEWRFGDVTTDARLALNDVTGGVTTLIEAKTITDNDHGNINETRQLQVCLEYGYFTGILHEPDDYTSYIVQSAGVTTHGGRKSGLGSGTCDGVIDFDDYTAGITRTTQADCRYCGVSCQGSYCSEGLASLYRVTISGLVVDTTGQSLCVQHWHATVEDDINATFIVPAVPDHDTAPNNCIAYKMFSLGPYTGAACPIGTHEYLAMSIKIQWNVIAAQDTMTVTIDVDDGCLAVGFTDQPWSGDCSAVDITLDTPTNPTCVIYDWTNAEVRIEAI